MKKCFIISLLFFHFFCLWAQAQKNDTIKQVNIVEKKVVKKLLPFQHVDSSILQFYQNTSLQNLLQLHSNVFVKNYGIGSLSTISIRGSSAAQTQVLWHGVNINNAMTGLCDFSNLPVSFFDKMDIHYVNNPENSTLSGAILLSNNKTSFYKHHSAKFAIGYESFNNYNASLKATLARKDFSNRLSMNIGLRRNAYSFFNKIKNSIDTLKHAGGKHINVMNDFSLRMNPNNILAWHVWIQHQQREIAPAIFEDQSAKEETTTTFRTLLKWDRQRQYRYNMITTLGLLYEHYHYQDSLILLNTQAAVINIPYSKKIDWQFKRNQHLMLQFNANKSFMLDDTKQSLHRMSLLGSYSVNDVFRRVDLKASMQKEITDVFKIPLIGSLSMNGSLIKGVSLYTTISSNYRVPTLNELYYKPGGNINLKPETSQNVEGGLKLLKSNQRHEIAMDVGLYHRKVKNWIAWYGASILTPHNIQKVWSRGVEGMLNYKLSVGSIPKTLSSDSFTIQEVYIIQGTADGLSKSHAPRVNMHTLNIQLGLFYSYTISTTEESAIQNDYSIGKQIPYVPRYQLKGNTGFKLYGLECSYVIAYTGYRFVTTDESQFLEPYFSNNIFASYKFYIKHYKFQSTCTLNNLFNANYESIVGRVMPGRNFSVGLMWDIIK